MSDQDGGRTYETYGDLLRDVSATYEVDPEEALALLTAQGPHFKPQLGHVYLFRASLTSRLKRESEAIAILQEALGLGIRLPERALHGSRGLASLVGTPSFESLVRASDAAYVEALQSTSASLLVREPAGTRPADGWPVLVALHGNNATPALEQQHWASITESGWLLALVGSSQPAWTPGYLIWDDRERSQRDVLGALDQLGRDWHTADTTLGGFSAGGLRALEIVLSGARPCRSAFTVAAFLTEELVTQMLQPQTRVPGVRCFMVVGDRDTSVDAHRSLKPRLEALGVESVIDVRPDLGHRYPSDMRETLVRAVDFVSDGGARNPA